MMSSIQLQERMEKSEMGFFDKLEAKVPLWQQMIVGLIVGVLVGNFCPRLFAVS